MWGLLGNIVVVVAVVIVIVVVAAAASRGSVEVVRVGVTVSRCERILLLAQGHLSTSRPLLAAPFLPLDRPCRGK